MEKTINVKTSRPVLRHKMYKSGKKWIVAGIAGAAAMTYSMTIHADTTSQQTTANSTNTQDINAGGNAVTNTSAQANSKTETTFNVSSASSPSQISSNALTESKVSSSQQGTIYTPVNVDHSKLDNAVNQASSAGVHVIHDTDTTQNTTNANLNSDRQKIEDQYNDQIADLQAKTRKAQHATENYNTYNNYQGDHTALDQAVNNTKSVPGLSISQTNGQTTSGVLATDDNRINQWKNNTQNDYSSQTAAINNAIATQKQNYQNWKTKYDQQMSNSNPSKAVITNNIYVPDRLQFTNQDVDVTINQPNEVDKMWKGSPWSNHYNSKHVWIVFDPKDGLTITWHNAAIDKNTGRKLNITWILNNIVKVPKNDPANWANGLIKRQSEHGWEISQDSVNADGLNDVEIYSNPIDEIGWANIAGFTVNEKLTYSDNGQEFDGTYYRSAGSLNAQYGMNHWEFASPISNVIGSYISPNSLISPNEQEVAGKASSIVKNAFMIKGHEYGSGMGGVYGDHTREALTKEGVTFLVKNNSVIAYGISGLPGSGQDATHGDTDSYLLPAYNEHLMGITSTAMDKIPMPTSKVHYHYDTKFNCH